MGKTFNVYNRYEERIQCVDYLPTKHNYALALFAESNPRIDSAVQLHCMLIEFVCHRLFHDSTLTDTELIGENGVFFVCIGQMLRECLASDYPLRLVYD